MWWRLLRATHVIRGHNVRDYGQAWDCLTCDAGHVR